MFKSTVADNFNYAYHLANLAKRPKMAIRKSSSVVKNQLPYSNKISPRLTEFGPLPWQAKQTVSALCQLQPATYLGGPNSVNPGQNLLVYGPKPHVVALGFHFAFLKAGKCFEHIKKFNRCKRSPIICELEEIKLR